MARTLVIPINPQPAIYGIILEECAASTRESSSPEPQVGLEQAIHDGGSSSLGETWRRTSTECTEWLTAPEMIVNQSWASS